MVDLENQYYRFEDAPNKVKPVHQLKRHTNETRLIWSMIKNHRLSYYGVIRDWTAVFGSKGTYVVIHHFVDEEPLWELFGTPVTISYNELPLNDGILSFFDQFVDMGYSISLPQQPFLDALFTEMAGLYNWHLESPVHKLSVIVKKRGLTLAIEVFGDDLPFPPYGVKSPIPWPIMRQVEEGRQLELFDIEPFVVQQVVQRPGKQMMIADKVPEHLEYETDEVIARVFHDFDVIVVPASGGKDSSVIMQKCLRFKQNHPDCTAELVIISADVLVENPLLQAHVRLLKAAVESMHIGVPFIIVEPPVEDTFMVTVFGRGYATPSLPNFKWCVSRLKTQPGRKPLESLVAAGKRVCQLLGLRDGESTSRAVSISKHYGDDFYGNHAVHGIKTAAPIRKWSATDVITYLIRNEPPWMSSYDYGNSHLINLYNSAMNGGLTECPIGAAILSENEAVRSCTSGAARTGCWSCTIVSDDTSLRNQMNDYPEEIGPLYRMRGYFKTAQDIRYMSYTGYKRDNHGRTRFEPGFGNWTIEIRTILLEKMSELNIPLRDDEVTEIYRQVQKRELTEGIPVTDRFRNILRSFYSADPIFIADMFDPVLNPTGTIDIKTAEDTAAIDRVLAMIDAGDIIPYW